MKETSAMYVHIPFCKNICTYCDFTKIFYSIAYEEKYLNALFYEIEQEQPNKCKTIYIGGGTPTVLSNEGLEKLLSFIQKYLDDNYLEFTIEVNPETVDESKVSLLKKYKVNRVSIGVQSFDEGILKLLGREHSYDDVKTCVNLLNKYGITNYSFDFMYGITGTNNKHIRNDVKKIIKLQPKHLSFYSLILEDHTCLKVKQYQEMDEEKVAKQYNLIKKLLSKNNFYQYEVSNYSIEGYKSKHNLVYWNDEEYYGFGLGASGYVNGVRYINTKNLTKYMNMAYNRTKEEVTLQDKKTEYVMLGLRLKEGISLVKYKTLFNVSLEEEKKEEIEKLKKQRLIKIVDDKLIATDKGMLLLNQIIVELI